MDKVFDHFRVATMSSQVQGSAFEVFLERNVSLPLQKRPVQKTSVTLSITCMDGLVDENGCWQTVQHFIKFSSPTDTSLSARVWLQS
jgi:hypothetical protein